MFGYLSDFTRHGEWSPTPFEMTPKTDGPVAVGYTFHSVGFLPPRDHDHENDVTVTALEPPTRLAFTASDRGQSFKSEFVLTPRNGGTVVRRTLDMPKPPGFAGFIFPIILSRVVKPGVQKGMDLLKSKLESGAS